jgi:hypothetical protein
MIMIRTIYHVTPAHYVHFTPFVPDGLSGAGGCHYSQAISSFAALDPAPLADKATLPLLTNVEPLIV